MEKISKEEFEKVYEIMEYSFPKEEIREFDRQKSLLDKDGYNLLVRRDENGVIEGFISIWKFDGFWYGEHLAVSENSRNKSIGTKIIKECLKDCPGDFVLEVEPAVDEITKRRIGFYERLGFKFNEFEYMQPKMRETTQEIPLNIMSYPDFISKEEFDRYKKVIYSRVYNVKD